MLPRGTSFRGGTLRETRVYDADTGAAVGPKLAPGGIVVDAEFGPDGAQVAIAALTAQTPDRANATNLLGRWKSRQLQVWDWKNGQRLVGPVPLPAEPRGLAFRPDGRTLAVVCADYRVVLVDPVTGAIRHNLDPGIRTRPFNANLWTSNGEALFSPDGRFLLTWERRSYSTRLESRKRSASAYVEAYRTSRTRRLQPDRSHASGHGRARQPGQSLEPLNW